MEGRSFSRFDPLAHPILFETPRRLSTFSVWRGHIPFAFLITQLAAPNTLIELGTHAGDSYCAFCQAVETTNRTLATRCFAVDTWRGDPQAHFYDDAVFADLRAHHDPLYASFSTFLRMTFDEALSRFPDSTVDLLHIDGLHTYEAVKHDFDSWLPKMSERGIVLLHDTSATHDDFGVYRLWDELAAHYPHSFNIPHASGLGVVPVGGKIPDLMQPLFAMPANGAEQTAFFALLRALGDGWTARGDLVGLGETVREREAQLAALHAERQAQADELFAQIGSLTWTVKEREVYTQQLEATNVLLNNRLAEITEQAAATDTRLRNIEASPMYRAARTLGMAGKSAAAAGNKS